jgi:hypothetical protein
MFKPTCHEPLHYIVASSEQKLPRDYNLGRYLVSFCSESESTTSALRDMYALYSYVVPWLKKIYMLMLEINDLDLSSNHLLSTTQ